MALSTVNAADPDWGVTSDDKATAGWMSASILVSLNLWILFQDGALKYIIYSIPVTLTAAYLIINHWQIRVHKPGAVALALYLPWAVISMTANSFYEYYAIRDIAIVGGYLTLFVLWLRAPSWTADIALVTLALGMVMEAATTGIGGDVNLFGSDGILESTLAFPIGIITIYYLHTGRWGRAVLASLLLFLAFKRIAFLGVGIAFGFDLVVGRYLRFGVARAIAFISVAVISVTALFSAQLFELVSSALDLEQTNANSISLGRYNIATMLWQNLLPSPALNWIAGFGPGSADTAVAASTTLINPHNDWLKILYDYGIGGFIILHAVLFLTLSEHRLALMLYLYAAVVMMTDNIFIYIFYHPFVFLMISTARR